MANNRPIDKTKKSNIKCEHCAYCDKDKEKGYWCPIFKAPKNYWNRCKFFQWDTKQNFKEKKNE